MRSRSPRPAIKKAARQVVPCRYVVWAGHSGGNQVALTFDDGPHPEHTPQVLATLAEAGARATFFVLGSQVEEYPAIVREMIAGGHELGNHTYTHVNLARIGWRRGCEELQATDRLLRRVSSGQWAVDAGQFGKVRGMPVAAELTTAHYPLTPAYQGLFRPPWGKIGLGGTVYSLHSGCPAALWSVDSEDYRRDGAQPLIERVTKARVQAGDILLFHDDNGYTAEAMAAILRFLSERGFTFATVSELVGKASPWAAVSPAVGSQVGA
jgi:peptidoglycan-N-acetylglucosamine deacetylase